mgnify:CR=1 FL=1
MKKYDYLIVGAGFFGATFARLMTDVGKSCLIIDAREHIGGNAYTEKQEGIDIHVYGPHIFHTNDEKIWNFVNRFTKFNNFILSPKVKIDDKLYSLPFNMNTFYEIWGLTTPNQVKQMIEQQKFIGTPSNLEEQALSLVGKDVYELLIKDYTIKQWKKHPRDLPASIIKRLPIRFTYNNNYFNDMYQGIPVNGYTEMFKNMLIDVDIMLNHDFFNDDDYYKSLADTVVYTGKIDQYYDYCYGELEYRSLEFKHEVMDTDNFQGNAVINYPSLNLPFTRIIEHKHFTPNNKSDKTIITKEIPTVWHRNNIPYYPINDDNNMMIYKKYRALANLEENVIFGGRLAEYKYYDMHQVIASAMVAAKQEILKF